MFFSASLYLATRNKLKCNPTFTDVAQACIGDISSILVNSLIAFCIWGVLTLYIILFSQICLALFAVNSQPDSFWAQKQTYVISLCVAQLPIVFLKAVHQAKFLSYFMCFGVLSLLTLLITKNATEGTYADRNGVQPKIPH